MKLERPITIENCILNTLITAMFGGVFFASPQGFAGAAGPSVGNPNSNESAEEPEPRAQVSSRRVAESGPQPTKFYAGVEGKHILNDYYDDKSARLKRQPSFHGRFQLGARLYNDRLDLSIAGGAVKMAATQAIFQKRPEFVADVYVVKGNVFNLLWYNMLQVPVRESDRDPTEFSDSDLYDRDSRRGLDASVVTIGLAPVLKGEWRLPGGKYQVRAGIDGWTKFYSKPLYVDETNADGGSGVGLIAKQQSPGDTKFEDRAMRYVHQESVAVGWTPNFAPALALDIGAHIESRYLPTYFNNEAGTWDYTYTPERRSFWRTKISLDVNQTWSVQDELYVFRNGFFAENRVNDERRYKNVVRIAAKL